MTAPPAAKRARASALDAAVSTLEVPGLGQPQDMFVMADGTRLFSTDQHTLQLLTPAGWLTNIAGSNDDDQKFVDGQRPAARFNGPASMTVDAAGHIVVVDYGNNALRRVSKAGEVSTLAGNGESGFADGQGEAARFNEPEGVALAANDELVVADTENHAIRVVTPGGAVRTLAGNGEAGFTDGQGAAARFNSPTGLARDKDGSILVADMGNNAVRRVTMEGKVSTVAGNVEAGYADGEGAAARFHRPTSVVVDKEGTIVVADCDNERLRKIVGQQVTTLAGGSEAGTADGVGAGTRFKQPFRLALDERGRLLVAEFGRVDSLRVVDASLAPPAWMGPVDAAEAAAAQAQEEKALETEKLKEDFGKLVEGELADVVLVVEGERFPAHRGVLAARNEYFRGLLRSRMQEGSGQQEISLKLVSAGAFRVVLRYLYTAAVPAWEELQGTGTGAEEDGAAGGGHGGRGKGVGKGGGGDKGKGGSKCKGRGKGKGKEAAGSEEDEWAGRAALELEVLKAADLFQAEGLLKHCLEGFRGALTVHTVVEQLVWAHKYGPVEARVVAKEFFAAHGRAVRVRV
jgi:sugar lactone lactonase YvrE